MTRERGRPAFEVPPPRPAYGRSAEDRPGALEWQRPAERGQSSRLADSLESGPLRDELGGTPIAAPVPVAPNRIARFRFTGEGAEYFRIWAVNLLLTLLTLGVYSAWAKVRKTRYFWQNTRLDGHVFDYHGSPRAILLGRVVALLLLIGYSVAFDFSPAAGLAMIVILCVAGPWLFMRAQRFKLANTSWRGLRFGFDSRVLPAYRAVLPPLLIWFSGGILAAVMRGNMGLLAAAGLVSGVMLPWMHHRLKAYQHDAANYGDRGFSFLPAERGFYAVYFTAGLVGIASALVGVLAFVLMTITGAVVTGHEAPTSVVFLAGAGLSFFAWLAAWPYFAARLQAVVWAHTRLGDVGFATAIAAWPLLRLTLKNVALTLASAGLYWPFASIALARYRIECMRAESDQPLAALVASTSSKPGLAAGDAAVDAFGLDIGI